MNEPLNKIQLEPTAGQANSVATLMQRRAAMLAASDTSAVRLIDEGIAALGRTHGRTAQRGDGRC